MFDIVGPNFQCDIVQKAYVKIPQDDEKYVFTRPSVFEKSVDKFNCF